MSQSRKALLTLVKVADLIVVTASFIMAIAATTEPRPATGGWWHVFEMRFELQNILFVAAYMGVWHFVFRTQSLYRSYRLSSAGREVRELGLAVLIAVAPLVPLKPILGFEYVNTTFLLCFSSFAFAALCVERRTLRALGRTVRRMGRNLQNVVIVGTGDLALEFASKLTRREDLGYQVVEVLSPGEGTPEHGNGSGAAAVLSRIETLIEKGPVDEIFVALPLDTAQPLIRDIMKTCEEQGVTVRLLAQVASLFLAKATLDAVEGQPVLTIHSGPRDSLALVAKRALDVVGALVGLAVLAPLLLLIAIVIKLDGGGAVLFLQERVGFNRRKFNAYKFRTMIGGAEDMQAAMESLNEADGPVFKIRNDPRVTRVGRWLRRLSLDELPQLLNVLTGEMSLVGPRPLPLRDANRIDVRWHKRRFSVKPGITCLWQVNSRYPRFDEWIRWDMEYIDNWSLVLDLKILLKTIPAVLSGQGVH